MTTYFIRVYGRYTTSGTYTDIPHTDIIRINMADNMAANDDPFEIVPRTATASIIKPGYEWLLSLTNAGFGVRREYDNDYAPDVNYQFYTQLFQILESGSNRPVFTGLIPKDGLKYDKANDTIDLTICDSLYVWITLAKHRSPAFGRINRLDATSNPAYWDNPDIIEFVEHPIALTGAPLSGVSVGDIATLSDTLVSNYEWPLPGVDKDPRFWTYADVLVGDEEVDSWCMLNRYACIWANAPQSIRISFFVIFQTMPGDAVGYKVKYYTCTLYTYNVIQPTVFVNDIIDSLTSLAQAHLLLKSAGALPSNATLGYQTVTAHYGELFENSLPGQIAPLWSNTTTYLSFNTSEHFQLCPTGMSPTSNDSFGQVVGTFNVSPEHIRVNSNETSYPAVMKGLCALYGLGMRGLPAGGIELYKHPILYYHDTLSGGITVLDADIINITAQGIVYGKDEQGESLTVFENADFLQDLFKKYYEDFTQAITTTYTITLPRSYYDANTLYPFQLITVDGKQLFVNKWSEPLYDDTITVEAIGGW